MRVLHLCDTPLSAAPHRLMQVQNIGGMNARLISHRDSYNAISSVYFESDLLLQKEPTNPKRKSIGPPSRAEVFDLFESADIIHCHNRLLGQFIFKLYPDLLQFLKRKKVVLQFHSPRGSLKDVSRDIRHLDVDERLVVAQFQTRLFPECDIVPNAIPIWDSWHIPVYHSDNPAPMVTYSPSNTNLKSWNNKGYKETIRAIKSVKAPHIYQEITNTPHKLCLELKQRADIAIDEIITGSYHMCTLEALSMGQVAICNIDRACEEALTSYTGVSEHPILKANANSLADVLTLCLNNPEEMKNIQKESRKFMETHWSTEKICQTFREIYER